MLLFLGGLLLTGLSTSAQAPEAGKVLDEAKQAGRDGSTFPHAAEDYFHDMDGAIALSPQEVAGRNMWLVWTGGNDRMWDKLTKDTFGAPGTTA